MALGIDSEHWVKNTLNTVYEAEFPTFLPELHFLRGNCRAKYIKTLANLWGQQICQY
ncbi:MAG: hypothetical protein U5K69_06895 [Balneolaceae bacterium]|nr:hypothetical protein [Balneolaceae bacterium]